MKHLRSFQQFEKKEAGMIPGYTDPNPRNKDYNWRVIPSRDSKKLEAPNQYKFSEISIGDKNPVKKFKQWDPKYWVLKKHAKKEKKSKVY